MTTTDALARLESLSRGFRANYLPYDQIVAQLRAWTQAFPSLCRMHSIGKTHEGHDLWLLTVGTDPERTRPSVWIDGNMHASEVSGSSVALAIAEDALRLHLAPESEIHGLPAHVRERLRDVVFHVLPRMSPDGAEVVLREGRYVRSNPRDRRPDRQKPRWVCGDVDGDGLSLVMRQRDPAGDYVESDEVPGLLLPRRLEDPGPYYKVYPEGHVEPWDGSTVPDPYFLSDNDTDLNRNFPWGWMPEPEQAGAGAYPMSEPEARAVVEFVSAHPELFAWLNLHTFGGVFIRPLGDKSDRKMDPFDLAVFRQIEEWGEQYTGYPTVSGFEEFTYEPDKPLHGELSAFGYHQRGCISYVTELWDLFRQIGIPRRKPFVEHYAFMKREELVRLAKWDREHNKGRVIRPWKPCVHPQLGEVEVGGIDTRVGLSNPPLEMLGELCARHAAMFLRVAAMAPALAIDAPRVVDLGGETYRVEVTVENRGYLPTYVMGAAKTLPWNEPVHALAEAHGCTLAHEADARRALGHLEGWGQGLHAESGALFHQRSRGSVGKKTVAWVVRGRGLLAVRAGSCRTGWVEKRVEVG